MGRGRGKVSQPSSRTWETAGGRLRWLLHEVWKGNCSAMAHEIGVSHTVVNRIDNGGREPGRHVLESLAASPRVNAAWVISGEGEPLAGTPPGRQYAVPVAAAPLPGPPLLHTDMVEGDAFDAARVFTPSQYWLRLERGAPVLNDPRRGLRRGDMVLMESDRRRFPAAGGLRRHLCAVKNPLGKGPPYVLALVEFHPASYDPDSAGPARLTADLFEQEVPADETVRQVVVNEFPDGTMTCHRKELRLVPYRGRRRVVEPDFNCLLSEREVAFDDVAAVWTGVLFREPDSL